MMYYNKYNIDGYLKLNISIIHNFNKLLFTGLYKFNIADKFSADDFSFNFIHQNGNEGSWYMSTIDTQTLKDIVNIIEDKFK